MNEAVEGVYEYWQIQREGKTTLMVRDMLRLKEFYGVDWTRFHCNFRVFIDGVNCYSSQGLLERMVRAMDTKERDLVFCFDELGQFLGARNYADRFQTKIANDLWQFPKRDLVFLYSDNVGLSADKTIRLATWESIFPKYVHGQTREEDYIVASVIKNYMNMTVTGIVIPYVYLFQNLFDTREPID